MLYKNVASQKIAVFAYTASTGAAKTGDAAQITAYISKDFAAGAATNDVNPTEMDATNMPGWYVFDLTQAETNAEVIVLAPKSSTSGVVLDQVQVFTQDAAISSRASQTSVDDVPTVVEFEARTLVAADYVVVSDLPSVPTASDNATAAAAAILAAADSDPISANVTYWAGVAVAAADANGSVPVVLYPTQGAVTFGQVKILADVANQGALHVMNSNAYGHGQYTEGGYAGQYNNGGNRGQHNQGGNYGQFNAGPTPVVGAAQQEIADALKRAPAAGTPAAGSVYDLLGDVDANVDLLLAMDTSTTDATTAGAISRRRGNSWSISLTIGAITGYTSLWFTIKSSHDDADTAALLQIKLNASGLSDGLLYVNGTTASSDALGSITVNNATTGAIVIAVDETITDDLAPGEYCYDVQTLIAGDVATPDSGTFTVTADVTRSVT